jgi:hypothetical protein
MHKLIAILLLAFASGCVAISDSRYRPCHELRTDMSISTMSLNAVVLVGHPIEDETMQA